ncbi:hypothetical protein CWI37_0487p0010 [Hamiltosporidium tvaerminnensis]|uniref:Uncharacterized protein n=1 Tax=Hamiltosporidium tvaerminnensis TaxID=1176355 RepID=A0A4Q9L5J7_9MICR|nr:hypothetical protein CWI37_0487p0010 [Hamiltosporidium tvaerminnensis]
MVIMVNGFFVVVICGVKRLWCCQNENQCFSVVSGLYWVDCDFVGGFCFCGLWCGFEWNFCNFSCFFCSFLDFLSRDMGYSNIKYYSGRVKDSSSKDSSSKDSSSKDSSSKDSSSKDSSSKDSSSKDSSSKDICLISKNRK